MTPIRVTEVLGYFSEPWKLDWYAKNGKAYCNRVSKQAQKIGTRVDELIKNPGTYASKKDKPEVHTCLEAYRKWLGTYSPNKIVPGVRINAVIEGVEVTGEPDLYVDGVIVDIKCASKISPSYWLQVNVYRYLDGLQLVNTSAEMMTGKVGILRLDKETGSFEYQVQDYDPGKVSVWCGLMRAYVYFNKEREHDGDEL